MSVTQPTLSFEFFPPRTEAGQEKLQNTWRLLAEKQPGFFSVTYGAGGSTRDGTYNTVKSLIGDGQKAAPHLSFGGASNAEMLELLEDYKTLGVDRLVALRGDIPSGMGGTKHLVHANELVEFVRKHTGDTFHIEVAAYPEIHPEAESYNRDIEFLKLKFDAGANSAITQYFYNADAYFYFMDACQKIGIDKPIFPGIMPITNFANLVRFSDGCGADIPRWIRQRLENYGDDKESLIAFGLEVVTELCEKLLGAGAPGLHFYTMNQAEPTLSLWENLGL